MTTWRHCPECRGSWYCPGDFCPCCDAELRAVDPPDGESGEGAGHPVYIRLLSERVALHKEKSGGYGTGADPFANFTAVASLTGQPRYLYPVHRAIEKLTRVLSLHAQGRSSELPEEFADIASLMDCANAMLEEDNAKDVCAKGACVRDDYAQDD